MGGSLLPVSKMIAVLEVLHSGKQFCLKLSFYFKMRSIIPADRLNHLVRLYYRDFVVQEMDTNEIRHITQMAYLSWPDHGVPESNEEFVDFVEKVRTCRQGYSLCPTVVHCSAGNVF